jgi:hypothetical protein
VIGRLPFKGGGFAVLAALPVIAACDAPQAPEARAPLHQAAYRAASARAFLLTCPGASGRAAVRAEAARFAALTRLAAGKRADHAIWAGGNDFAAMTRYRPQERCVAGENAYDRALTAYRTALDNLAHEIAEYRP